MARLNIPLLTDLAEWFEAGAPHRRIESNEGDREVTTFDMENGLVVDDCGTSCCIAGAAVVLLGGTAGRDMWRQAKVQFEDQGEGEAAFYGSAGVYGTAQRILGLSDKQANDLFTPGRDPDEQKWLLHDPEFYTADRAGRVVRHLIATGEVDWNR